MLDMIRKAVIGQKINEIKGELQQAGASIQELLLGPDLLDKLDAETVWRLIHGLDASFIVMERTLRSTLSEEAEVDPAVRKTLRDLQAAVTKLRESLGSVVPFVQTVYDTPPKPTQWRVIAPDEQA